MDELDRGGECHVVLAPIAAHPGRQEREHRPDALAAGRDQVAGELGDQPDLALQPVEDQPVDPVEVGRDQGLRLRERRPRRFGTLRCCRRHEASPSTRPRVRAI